MSDKMTFPETWEEFEKSYGFTDSEEIYTNGSRLIPSFRVKQWLDHEESKRENKQQATKVSDCVSRQDAKDAVDMALDTIDHVPEWVYDILLNSLDKVPSASTKLSNNSPKLDNENGELISRQAAVDTLDTIGYDFSESGLSESELEEVCEAVGNVRQDMISRIKNLPSASPDLSTFSDKLWKIAYERGKAEGRKKGKWIEIMDADEFGEPYPCGVRCSECGFCSVNLDNFCPNCGAKMENDL